MPVFIGLDLAWTPTRPTGVCILRSDGAGVTAVKLHSAVSRPDCFATLCTSFGPDVVVAIDAPLILHPERAAERALGRFYGSRQAAAYTPTQHFLEGFNGIAGPVLASRLLTAGFDFEPSRLEARPGGWFALEVYPHAAHIELFELQRSLKYKRGRVAERRKVFLEYQRLLATYLGRELPEVAASPLVVDVLRPEQVLARGRALKSLEDRLDALTCAVVAHHAWEYGPSGIRVFGEPATGAIVVPRPAPPESATSAPVRTSPSA